jgi:acyl-coenzyme A synthetase/AMP-(fatty) acid ligase
MSANVVELIFGHAASRPANPAIISQEQAITYRQLRVMVGIAAAYLKQRGIVSGQVVGMSMGQHPLHVIIMLALAQIGAVSLPLHVAVPTERRLLAARRFGATCIVSGRDDMRLDGLSFVSLSGLSLDGRSTLPDQEIFAATDDAPFRIAISSGTSGDPKGMVFTHKLICSRIDRPDGEWHEIARTMVMDLNFALGFRPALTTLAKGASLVMPASMSADRLLHAIVSHGVTRVALSPAQVRSMTDQFAEDGIHCPSLLSLRVVGGPLPPAQLGAARRTLTPNVHVGYGSTESSMVSWASPDILDRASTTVGQVCPWARVEVVDAGDKPIPPGETGHLRIRSEDQVAAYYRDEERNRKHFRDGWYYPGDLGHFDAEGLLYIDGRADDQLNVGGHKINPEDIDAVLAEHDAVAEAGAFVFNGEEGQEVLAAAIVLRDPVKLADVKAHALARLGPLAPSRYFTASALPRTVTGKLRRIELSALFSQQTDGQ